MQLTFIRDRPDVRVPTGWLVGMLLAGCSFHPNPSQLDATNAQLDAEVDGWPLDAGPCIKWSALDVDPCDPDLGAPALLELWADSYTLDTETAMISSTSGSVLLPGAIRTQPSGSDARVINLSRLAISTSATLLITGSHPLIIVVHGSATISGSIDVSARASSAGSTPGPGGNDPIRCTGATGANGNDARSSSGGGGGAGGGGFGGTGADGGDGQGNGHGGKGSKGVPTGAASLVPIRGGCGGGKGGDDFDPLVDNGGRPGAGGGAIEITALSTIELSGRIISSGSGGGASSFFSGGGGAGGSGGAILLDGDHAVLSSTASVCANGGGGGEGGHFGGVASQAGQLGTCSKTLRAAGGATEPDGGDGGGGGTQSSNDGVNATNGANGAGGGGGGGGVGRIRVHGRTDRTIDSAAIVSPDAVP